MDPTMTAGFIADLPKFSGDPSVDGSFANFLKDYKLYCDTFGLEDEKCALTLGRALEGYAKEAYKETVTTTPTLKKHYANLSEALGEKFKPLMAGKAFSTQAFYARKQMPGESVVAYYNDLRRLARQADPEGHDAMPDSQFLEKFFRGLPRVMRHLVVAKEPKTPEKALEEACKIQAQRDFVFEVEDLQVNAVLEKEEELTETMEKNDDGYQQH